MDSDEGMKKCILLKKAFLGACIDNGIMPSVAVKSAAAILMSVCKAYGVPHAAFIKMLDILSREYEE